MHQQQDQNLFENQMQKAQQVLEAEAQNGNQIHLVMPNNNHYQTQPTPAFNSNPIPERTQDYYNGTAQLTNSGLQEQNEISFASIVNCEGAGVTTTGQILSTTKQELNIRQSSQKKQQVQIKLQESNSISQSKIVNKAKTDIESANRNQDQSLGNADRGRNNFQQRGTMNRQNSSDRIRGFAQGPQVTHLNPHQTQTISGSVALTSDLVSPQMNQSQIIDIPGNGVIYQQLDQINSALKAQPISVNTINTINSQVQNNYQQNIRSSGQKAEKGSESQHQNQADQLLNGQLNLYIQQKEDGGAITQFTKHHHQQQVHQINQQNQLTSNYQMQLNSAKNASGHKTNFSMLQQSPSNASHLTGKNQIQLNQMTSNIGMQIVNGNVTMRKGQHARSPSHLVMHNNNEMSLQEKQDLQQTTQENQKSKHFMMPSASYSTSTRQKSLSHLKQNQRQSSPFEEKQKVINPKTPNLKV